MKIAIAQPTYLPWCGYFDLIDQVEALVILDSVQFEKQSWQHRNRIKTPAGLQWLTVPVQYRGHFGQKICEVEIRDAAFAKKHARAIELNYRRASFFENYFPDLARLIVCQPEERLVDLNLRVIEWFCSALQIKTRLVRSSNMAASGKRTELLANICGELGATEYVSPLGSAEYLLDEMQAMTGRGIRVSFQHYEHPEYAQLFPPFAAYASAIDLLFNEGPRAGEIMRSGRRTAYRPSDITARETVQV